jgi:hypothetical protein
LSHILSSFRLRSNINSFCGCFIGTKTLKSKDIDGTVLKDDKESVHGKEGDSDSDDEEEEEEDGDNSSAGEYETDDASVDE